MAIGMTYEQYWYGDPLMVRAYYKAHKLRREQADEDAWMHGLYVLSALAATVGNIGNHGTPNEYPGQPYSVKEKERKRQEKEERDQEQERLMALAWMTGFVQAGKHWSKKG